MSFKVPVIQRDEYTVSFEVVGGNTWLHCDVRRWAHSVLRQMRADGDALYAMHGGPWFAFNEPAGCEKHRHFLRMFGFEFFSVIDGPLGTQYAYKR